MLQRYEGKRIRLTDEYGEVFTGVAEAYPSGFGLHEFDRAEESIRLGDTFFFLSQIRTIEELSTTDKAGEDPRRYDVLMGKLLEGPYRIVDILPGQAPAEGKHGGQYFAVERYFLQAERLRALRRRYAELLLRLNCYYRMDVSFDSCGTWETNPDPGRFADRLETLSGKEYLRHVHIASRGDRKMPGEHPDADRYTDGFRALKELGYEGYVSFECGCGGDRAVLVPAAVELLRQQWAEA